MSEIVNRRIEDYVTGLVPSRDPALAAVEKAAEEHHVPMIGPYDR